ncbi:MAG: hypothetical protein DMF54_01420 [Acidobacteria bacterium]|nr:MAG: hypothetical protein DMF54_01420 [Acidobacteriota bacterium]
MSRRGRAFLSGLGVALLFALPLLPEIVGARRLVFRDAHITHWPWRRVAMTMLSSGQAPFVNDTASGGQPFLANPNAGLLYPTVLFEKVFSPAAAFNLHYLLHVLWAFFGARALATRLGLSEGGAFFSGVAFAFSGMMLSYGSAFANAGPAAAWLPWCVAAALDTARAETLERRLGAAIAAGLAFGLQILAGEPAITLLTVLFAAPTAVAASAAEPGRRLFRIGRTAAAGLLAGLIAAALAAPLLLPLSQVFRLTYRGQHLYSARAFGASPFAAWRIVEWLFPRFDGDPGALGPGAHWQYRLHSGDLVYIWSVTFGVLPLLALALAAARRRFWSRTPLLLAAAALGTLLLSFGFSLPLYRLLYSTDFFRRLRYPIKFYLLTTLCVALLSGFAIDAVRRHRGGRLEALLLAGFVALYAAGFLAAAENGPLDRIVRPYLEGLAASPGSLLPAIRGVFRGDAAFGVTAAALLGAVSFSRRPARGGGHALGFATLLLALPWGLPLFVSADQKDLTRPPALLPAVRGEGRLYVSPRLPELAVLQSGTSHPELPPTVARLSRVQVEEMIPATGAPFAVRYLFEEDPDGSYGYVNRIAGEVLTASKPEERARLLRLFGARWVLGEAGSDLAGFHPVTGFSVAGRRLVLLETNGAAPELRWASRLHLRASLSGALELARSDLFRSATDVVLPGDRERNGGLPGPPGTVAVRALQADRASVDVEARAAGHLVFSRTFFPGWKAVLDGSPARVVLANGRDLAVAVPAGRHHVEMFWNPAPFRFGVALQGLALFLAVAAGVLTIPRSVRVYSPTSGSRPR